MKQKMTFLRPLPLTCLIVLGLLLRTSGETVSVQNEAALKTAIQNGKTDIVLEKGFTTTGNLNIPAGTTVTLADGVTLTVYYDKNKITGKVTAHYLTGEGTIQISTKKRIITGTRHMLPVCGDEDTIANVYSGAIYQKTRIETEGSGGVEVTDISQKGKVNVYANIAWREDGAWENVACTQLRVAVFTTGETGVINGRSTLRGVYSNLPAAYVNAASTDVIVILENNLKLEIDENIHAKKELAKSIRIDAADNALEILANQVNNAANVTILNATLVSVPKLTNGGASFINCTTQTVTEFNANKTTYTSFVHMYDCANAPSVEASGNILTTTGAGICFYSGGPYATNNWSQNFHVYGGTYKADPSAYLVGDLAVTKLADKTWQVHAAAPAINVAKIGETEYATIQAAVDAATAGETVTLITDTELVEPVVVAAGKTVTIDLYGHDIAAPNGAFINHGTLKLEDNINYGDPGTVTTETGDLLVNDGTLNVTYGTYAGDIRLDGGRFTVHHGTFDGTIRTGANVTDAASVVNLRGGRYRHAVTALLADGYRETTHEGYLWVGRFPYAVVTDTYLTGAEKAWSLTGLPEDDLKIFAKTSTRREDYSDADWYRRAELISMLTPYTGDVIDCVISFDRAVKSGSLRVYMRTDAALNSPLDTDLAANERHSALIPRMTSHGYTPLSYSRFLTEKGKQAIAVGFENLSDDNAGTTCTIECHLCEKKNGVYVTKHVLASETVFFPWKEAIPPLRGDDTPETVASALAGTADPGLTSNITNVTAYTSYRNWATGLKGATADGVKASGTAWLSYALNATNLVATPIAGDLTVETIAPSSTDTGTFTLTLALKDVAIGVGTVPPEQMRENLSKVFNIEGASSLTPSAFSRDNVDYVFGTPADGKVTVGAKPIVATPAFFMRAKITP